MEDDAGDFGGWSSRVWGEKLKKKLSHFATWESDNSRWITCGLAVLPTDRNSAFSTKATVCTHPQNLSPFIEENGKKQHNTKLS